MKQRLLYNQRSCINKIKILFPPPFQAETPIEEFAPTPAFPALQYLESVDQGGVAWRAGLRTGDFLIEVRAPRPRPAGHRTPGLPAHLSVCRPGERRRRGEGGSPAGGLPDPPGGQPPADEGRVRLQEV